jgi:hypothetical protein
MRSAQRENQGIEAEPLAPNLMLNSFGKVVGSIEGLRHRLDSLTIDEIDDAQEKLTTLSLRLSELQRTLEWLSTIKDRSVKADAAKAEIVAETVDVNALQPVPTPLQLHTIGQLRNLIIFPRANRAAAEPQDRSSQGLQNAGPVRAHDAAQTPSNRSSAIDANKASTAYHSSDPPAEPETQQSSAPEESNETNPQDLSARESEDSPSSNDDRAGAAASAWAFGSPRKDDEPATPSTPVQETEPPLRVVGAAAAPAMEWQEKPVPAAAVLSDSQIASGFEFDQRLLNDLIKDYGEFVIPSPASTATAAEPSPEYPPPANPQTQAEFPVVENVTVRETLPTPRKDGDLDRKLKKLIKDYGEYDLYSDQTARKYRAGVVAAFAILGAIFGGIYFFFPSQKEVLINSSPAIQSESGSESAVEDARKGDATLGTGSRATSNSQGDTPEQTDLSGSRGSGIKPRANKNNKNNEKAGKGL